jgi:hypothetical protein
LVQRRERHELAEGGDYRVVQHGRLGEARAAMDDAMADGHDLVAECAGEPVEDEP